MEKMMMRNGRGKNTNSWTFVYSCLKAVSTSATNVVRSAVSAVSSLDNDQKDQVTWAGFGELKFSPTAIKHVLLIAYTNGFQVIDVEDSCNFNELVSKRDLPVIFLEILPMPLKHEVKGQISSLHPILLVLSAKEDSCRRSGQNSLPENCVIPMRTIRFYSFVSHSYIKVLSFSSHVFMVRSSPRIIAVGLKSQICCIDACSLEKKFNVSTYPVPQFEGQGQGQVINTGYGPMAVGPRWLAYAPETPYISSGGHLKDRNFPGITPSSKAPGNNSLMSHFVMPCGKQIATAMMNFRGYKTLSEHYPGLLVDDAISPVHIGGKTAQEMEYAGTVAIKDVLSTAIITQFRAHTSPISALCFDPSGTLLVTASIHGNSLNIFRIMPLARCNGSTFYNWSSSHIHLYKLYRGITSAVIQDICFSHCCRWVSIVSSKGTCHIFLLPPLVSDATVQTCHSHLKNTSSRPWWSTSSFTLKEQQSFPPSPSTFSVVARIKDTSFSLLHLKNVAVAAAASASASATGMKVAPSGALAATFHASIADAGLQDVHLATRSVEHLLVFTSTGFVVQYKLLPSASTELSDVSPKIQPSLQVKTQDEVFRVDVESLQWWDVCRRSDHSERHDYSLWSPMNEVEDSAKVNCPKMMFLEDSAGLDKSVKTDRIKAAEIQNWHILNVEVRGRSARSPIWQRSKICFHVMTPPISQGSSCGELEIERFSSNGVEVKGNDLQPVFGNFPSVKSAWVKKKCKGPALPYISDRGVGLEYDTSRFSMMNQRDMVSEASVVSHTNQASVGLTGSSDGGSSTPVENLVDLELLRVENSQVSSRHTLDDLSDEETGNVKYERRSSTSSVIHPELYKMTLSTEITELPTIGAKKSVGSMEVFEDSQLAKVGTDDELENSNVSGEEEPD